MENEISLIRHKETGKFTLSGITDEVVPDDRIIRSVQANRTLFPHVVKCLAKNRLQKNNPDFCIGGVDNVTDELIDEMRNVRNELTEGVLQCDTRREMIE